MEPPSHISADSGRLIGQMSEDPLSGYIFLIVDSASDEDEGYIVCASLAHTGLSYICRAGEIES